MRLRQYVRKGRSLDAAMRWDHHLECLGRTAFLEADVTSALPDNHSGTTLEGVQHLCVEGSESCSHRDFELFGIRAKRAAVVHRLTIQLDSSPNIAEGFFPCVALADAARQSGNYRRVPTFIARLKNNSQVHGIHFLQI